MWSGGEGGVTSVEKEEEDVPGLVVVHVRQLERAIPYHLWLECSRCHYGTYQARGRCAIPKSPLRRPTHFGMV